MKNGYALNYDLKAPGRNYDALYEEIKKSQLWWHYLDSTWLIVTSESASQVWDRIGSHIDKNDFMLIIEVRDNVQGWLPEDAWKWIHKNIPT